MEKLSKEDSGFLAEIRPHDPGAHYFAERFADADFDTVYREAAIIRSLERHGMIETSREVSTKSRTAPLVTEEGPQAAATMKESVEYPTGFVLTSDGRTYHKERRKATALRISEVIVTAILCGFFAWAFLACFPV